MKLVIAYIQPDKLNATKEILHGHNIHRFSVIDSFGHSEEAGYLESYRGVEMEIDMLKKTRIEIAVNDDFVQPVVDAIIAGGKSGKIGDGKIFIVPIDNVYRIRTGEEGSAAIG